MTRRILEEPGQFHEIGNRRDEGTLVFEAQPLDAEGNPLLRHELWRKAGGSGQRVIFPRYSDHHVYRLTIPAHVQGPLAITADLNFRRYRQEFLDLTVPHMERGSGVRQRLITQSSDRRLVDVLTAAAGEH